MLAKERLKANPPKKEAADAPAPAAESPAHQPRPKQLKRKKRR
jgi:hypothetical protein